MHLNSSAELRSKLNSISLSKNILRALHASHTDLPPMEAFPKSHIVTFKYYVGVILFLEENYAKVCACNLSPVQAVQALFT